MNEGFDVLIISKDFKDGAYQLLLEARDGD